jgi:spore germination protein
VKSKAQKFFHLKSGEELKVVENGKGTEYSSYSVTALNPKSQNNLQADFSKIGGHLIYFMNTRDVKTKKISMDEAVEFAHKFLDKQNYKHMEPVSYDMYDQVAHFAFAAKQGDVMIYPEKLSIMVAMDDGEVTGLQATDYIYHHKQRKLTTPKLKKEAAKKALNPEFKLKSDGLALIENELDQEVLCYEFIGGINGNEYRIYINADTGLEEQIDQISPEDIKLTS